MWFQQIILRITKVDTSFLIPVKSSRGISCDSRMTKPPRCFCMVGRYWCLNLKLFIEQNTFIDSATNIHLCKKQECLSALCRALPLAGEV